MPASKTITIPVSGRCPRCGITNNAKIPTMGPIGTKADCVANASCGACQARVKLTGSVVIK